MTLRTLVSILGGALASMLVSVPAPATPVDFAPPATHSLLDPVRLAADFAPDAPAAPSVAPFEQAADDTTASPADSLAPADAGPVMVPPLLPAGPVLYAAAPPEAQPPLAGSIVGALVGGAVGLFGGGALGLAVVDDDGYYEDYEEIGAFALGASIGEMFLMPAGAHVGNGGRGSYWSALGGSALGYVATLAFSYAGPIGTVCGLVLQTTLTVAGERRSAKRRAAEQAAGTALP